MDSSEINETLKAAQSYLQKLKDLDDEIKNAQAQITNTSEEAESNLLGNFSSLQEYIIKLLAKRKCELLDKILTAREEGITPLSNCSSIVKKKIEETEKLIDLGNLLQEGRIKDTDKGLEKFTKKSAQLGSLPEVPALKEVPYISFDFDDSCESDLADILSNYGNVTRIAPIQICQMTEKPGAILVEWQIVDLEEKSVDIQEFCLQKTCGDALLHKLSFQTCYQGVDSQYLVKDLKVDEFYSFQVSCKFEGSNQLSRWSLPQKFKTTLKPFSWKENGHYSMNNDCKIAKPLIDSAPILISDGPQFKVGYTIEFTILEKDENIAYLGIITDEKITKLSSINNPEGSFVLNSEGEIEVDGLRKSTHLPNFQKGAKVSFSCECIRDEKVVIHIDLNEKRVTYEWGVDKTKSFYFAAELPTPVWKIMVE
ncbi:hypothetical protein HHI36_017437 [Cryptolaemus montrouzieri]|uniref:Fibronectin type-III domain-containing protein n=1 Tax=Cryptolaemus montrouzieri TaxID=559131 RepID=A0ABD2NMI7_9CUCU